MTSDQIMTAAVDQFFDVSTYDFGDARERCAARFAIRAVVNRLGRSEEFEQRVQARRRGLDLGGEDADAMS